MLLAPSALSVLATLLPQALAHAIPASHGRVLADDGAYVTVKLAKMNNRQLLFADTVDSDGKVGWYNFGASVEMAVDVTHVGSQREVDSALADRTGKYSVHRVAIESAGALSLNVNFAAFFLPQGAELYLIGEKDIHGPYTHSDNQPHGKFGTWPVAGSRLLIEVWTPAEAVAQVKLVIESVVHGYRALGFDTSCDIDVACPDSAGWDKEIRSVGVILGGYGKRLCTGFMINNARNDGRQLFVTSARCKSDIGWDRSSVLFNYQLDTCNGTGYGPMTDQVHGLKLLTRHDDSNFALMEILQPIPASYNVHLAGFYAGEANQTGVAVGIHHPAGLPKKMAVRDGELVKYCYGCDRRRQTSNHWQVPRWTKGSTHYGSAGSPLFNADHLAIGQLTGGSARCYIPDGYDLYGAFFASWSAANVKMHLDPDNTGSLTVPGVDLNSVRRPANQPSISFQATMEN